MGRKEQRGRCFSTCVQLRGSARHIIWSDFFRGSLTVRNILFDGEGTHKTRHWVPVVVVAVSRLETFDS